MNSLPNKIKFIETNVVIINCKVWGIHPNLPHPTNGPSCKLLTDILKGYLKRCHGHTPPVGCRLITPDGGYIALNGRIKKGLEGSGHSLIKVLSQHMFGGTGKP
jgi:hypothetical protein